MNPGLPGARAAARPPAPPAAAPGARRRPTAWPCRDRGRRDSSSDRDASQPGAHRQRARPAARPPGTAPRWDSIVSPAALTSTSRSTHVANADRQLQPDEPAHRVADDDRARDAQRAQQLVDRRRVARDRDLLPRHRRRAEPRQVHRDAAPPGGAKNGRFSSQFCHDPLSPWIEDDRPARRPGVGPRPDVDHVHRHARRPRPSAGSVRQSMSSQALRPAGPYRSTATVARSGVTALAMPLR